MKKQAKAYICELTLKFLLVVECSPVLTIPVLSTPVLAIFDPARNGFETIFNAFKTGIIHVSYENYNSYERDGLPAIDTTFDTDTDTATDTQNYGPLDFMASTDGMSLLCSQANVF